MFIHLKSAILALTVMGKDGPDGRYLSVAEVEELLVQRRLPERMRCG